VWHHNTAATQLQGNGAPTALDAGQLQVIFDAQAAALQIHSCQQVNEPLLDDLNYIGKAVMLSTRLDLGPPVAGERAWSDLVPARLVFDRLHAYLHTSPPRTATVAPTVLEVVQQALDKMIIRAEALGSQASPTATVLSAPNDDTTQNGGNNDERIQQDTGIDALFADIDTPVLQQPAPQRPPMARFRHDERPPQRPSRSAGRLEEPR
jgi:hypothetical protein